MGGTWPTPLCAQPLDLSLDFAQPKVTASGTHVIAPIVMGSDKAYACALTNSGRFAVATTVCECEEDLLRFDWAANEHVNRFVEVVDPAMEFLTTLAKHTGPGTRGFNLVVGDGISVGYYSNRCPGTPVLLSSGVHVLSNALLGTPWAKCEYLRGRTAPRLHDFLMSTLVDRDRLPPSAVPAADVPPASRRENYDLCELLLQVLGDRTAPVWNPQYHCLPPSSVFPLLSSAFLPAVETTERTLYGTHTSVVAVVPPFGECLYAQRSLAGPVRDLSIPLDETRFCRKDVVFVRMEDAGYRLTESYARAQSTITIPAGVVATAAAAAEEAEAEAGGVPSDGPTQPATAPV